MALKLKYMAYKLINKLKREDTKMETKVDMRNKESMKLFLKTKNVVVKDSWDIATLRAITKKQQSTIEQEVILDTPTVKEEKQSVIKSDGNIDIICGCHVQKYLHYYNQCTHKLKMLAFLRDKGVIDLFTEDELDLISNVFYLRIGEKIHRKGMMFINDSMINKDKISTEARLELKEKLCNILIETGRIELTLQNFLTFRDPSILELQQQFNIEERETKPKGKYTKKIAKKSFNAIKTIIKLPGKVAKKSTSSTLNYMASGMTKIARVISKES